MTDQPKCKNCDSTGWVCENHPHVSWGEGDGCCGGAGAPCPVCNTESPARFLANATIIWTADDGVGELMADQPYCRACTHFNEANGKRCWHPQALTFDRVEGEVHPLIGEHVTSLCDIYNRFEPKGQ